MLIEDDKKPAVERSAADVEDNEPETTPPKIIGTGTEQFSIKQPSGEELILVSGRLDIVGLANVYFWLVENGFLSDPRNKSKKEPPSSVL